MRKLKLQNEVNFIHSQLYLSVGWLKELLAGSINAGDFGKTANARFQTPYRWSLLPLFGFCLIDIDKLAGIYRQ
jgi:hypothetical protein